MKTVLAIIPAHSEEKNVPGVIKSLKAQTYPVTICIVSDNSTDRTVDLARELGADIVTETIGNKGQRSGAVNHGIDRFAKDYDYILVMDCDSVCAIDMIEEGLKAIEADPQLGAVCSRAGVLPQPELKSLMARYLWHCQNIEYAGYDASRVETTGRIKTAHGLATLFRMEALKEQKADKGYIYNNEALTEDYWLTVDLKLLGWKVTGCQKMKAWTIVPTRLGWLKKQRARWLLGGLDCIFAHGLNRVTAWDLFNTLAGFCLITSNLILLAVLALFIYQGGSVGFSYLFFLIYGVMWIDSVYRLRYLQNATIWDVLITVLLVPNVIYGTLHVAFQILAYWQFATKAKRTY